MGVVRARRCARASPLWVALGPEGSRVHPVGQRMVGGGSMSDQPEAEGAAWGRQISRRTVLLLGGSALVVAGLGDDPARRLEARALAAGADPDAAPSATLHMVRPDDMLVLDFDFYNLVPSYTTDPPQLVKVSATELAYVVVGFGPQHVMEQTIYESDLPTAPSPGSVASKAVGPSRIAFVVPGTVKSLPYTEAGLLGWWQWVMQVVA